ncbi:MAG: hypothetical protein BEU01_00070 [Marine Group III euryarchaeote CG-Epi4]|uniref:Zinc-ribbon domain-containing protein n=1 Tax=Marine Group III euryarchaeote CG-Epi4 TaxID=1888998 RepID=A0A1J5TNE2_9ARCH|nr:MAG: hypothetical protein BEU01_00070 [Marine Group III euryarchaeote CG-Epi4]
MDFEQLVCYSQTIIILILIIGYIINYQNNSKVVSPNSSLKCSSCGDKLLGDDPNYCSNCGHMNSHSKGSNLEK